MSRSILTAAILTVATLALVVANPLSARAQSNELIDYRVEFLTEQLQLSAEQSAQYRTLLEHAYQELMENLDKTDDDPKAAVRIAREIMASVSEQIDGILTPKQKTAYAQLKSESIDWLMRTTPDQLAERIHLTDDQKQKMVAILEANGASVAALHQELNSDKLTVKQKR